MVAGVALPADAAGRDGDGIAVRVPVQVATRPSRDAGAYLYTAGCLRHGRG